MKYILVSFFCITYSLSLQAQSSDERAIRRVLANQTDAWNRGNLEAFMQGYWRNDSLMFIGKNGVTYGWSNTLANYKNGYPDTSAMGKLSFKILAVKPLSPEYFHITGKWMLQRSIGDLIGHFTLVFRKIKGEWVIISDHSS
jgi:ketosteroid isomerase-like protein